MMDGRSTRDLMETGRFKAWIVVGLGILLMGCGDHAHDPAKAAGPAAQATRHPIEVVATTSMITDLVKEIGGDAVRVTGLMGEGVDPHLYKASPGDVQALQNADLIFYNGLLLEGKMVDLFIRLAAKKPTHAVTAPLDESVLRSPPEFAGHHDPHVWFDVSLWRQCAAHVRDVLKAFDPGQVEGYDRRAAAYLSALDQLHREVKREIHSIPKTARVMVTAHDAFGYFGRAYDIEVRAIQGISTESEASVKAINDLVDFIVSRGVKAVFVESSVSEKNIKALVEGCRARGHALKIGGQLYSDAIGARGTPEGSYLGAMRHNVRLVVSALK